MAVGMAKGLQMREEQSCVYVILGDGELQEGQVWEALRFASTDRLTNLCPIIDHNHLQQTCRTPSDLSDRQLIQKIAAFGWEVIEVDGHDIEAIQMTLINARQRRQRLCVIAQTHKGKGISFMEDQLEWHVREITPAEVASIRQELSQQEDK